MKTFTRALPWLAAVLLTLCLAAVWQDELSAAWDGFRAGVVAGVLSAAD
jgi:hypothetical protein